MTRIEEIDIYTEVTNTDVTSFYVSIISEALNSLGFKTCYIDSITKKRSNRNRGFLGITPGVVNQAKRAGYGYVVFWSQGVLPEESYMRHQEHFDKYARYLLLSLKERKAIKKSDFVFFVSERMLKYYKTKYMISPKHYYIMPCFNEEFDINCFYKPQKYEKHVFTYAGSMAPWQCFEKTVKLYSEIEKEMPDSLFKIYTGEKDKALEIIRRYSVRNYTIEYLEKSEVRQRLSEVSFGFCIRDDNIINRVATPTKLSSYVCSGVIPIFSNVLEDFSELTRESRFCVCVNAGRENDAVSKILTLCKTGINSDEVYRNYMQLFSKYYSREYHIDKIIELLKNTIGQV